MTLFGSLKVSHWSDKDLAKRAEMLGKPFEEIYQSLYKQFSWHVHAGLAGFVNAPPETFAYLFGVSCQIAALGYEEILKAVIKEFKVSNAIPAIDKELEFAKLRAGTGGDEKLEARLRKGLGLS